MKTKLTKDLLEKALAGDAEAVKAARAIMDEAWPKDDVVRCERGPDVVRSRETHVVAADRKPWRQGEEVSFVYLPEGTHTVTAGFNEGSIRMTVKVDAKTADAAQASLDRLKADRPRQTPYGCVEHREQEASVVAKAFGWADGRGVLLTAEPTALGERNVNGRIHWSWSPSFKTDADYAKCECAGCGDKRDACECSAPALHFPAGARGSASNPARVTGVDFVLGTLTNRPAFDEMPPVTAEKKEQEGETVEASGTSEGVKKAWETRRVNAHNLSNEANEESNKLATMTGSVQQKTVQHMAAGNAHLKARNEHQRMASEASDSGMHTQAGYHNSIAQYHNAKWQQHVEDVVKMGGDSAMTTDAKPEPDSVLASVGAGREAALSVFRELDERNCGVARPPAAQ